eukprot:scaffold37933_cov201-Skeletonema_marinoi.AAC.3
MSRRHEHEEVGSKQAILSAKRSIGCVERKRNCCHLCNNNGRGPACQKILVGVVATTEVDLVVCNMKKLFSASALIACLHHQAQLQCSFDTHCFPSLAMDPANSLQSDSPVCSQTASPNANQGGSCPNDAI